MGCRALAWQLLGTYLQCLRWAGSPLKRSVGHCTPSISTVSSFAATVVHYQYGRTGANPINSYASHNMIT